MWSIHLFVLSAHTELPKQCFLIKLVVNGIISKAFLFRKKIGIFFFFFFFLLFLPHPWWQQWVEVNRSSFLQVWYAQSTPIYSSFHDLLKR